jgi:hypothetical protein
MIRWRRFRESLYNPHANPLIFFVAAFCTGISINVVSSLLIAPETSKVSTISIGVVTGIVGIIVLILAAPAVFRWWTGNKDVSAKIRPARYHKGLIAIASIGPGIDTARKAIEYHLPALEKAWLICSDGDGPSSRPHA